MLNLLSIDDAAYFICCWQIKKKSSFAPESRQEIANDEEMNNKFLFFRTIITNAVLAGEIPALKKAKGRAADKKILKKLEIPADFIEELAQYEYWITWEDLQVFMERPSYIEKEYSHGRDALVRVICALIGDGSDYMESNLIEYLSQKTETSEIQSGTRLSLGDNTIKSVCREIADTFNAITSK